MRSNPNLSATNVILSPFERWMVESNVEAARAAGVSLREQADLLRANGYHRVAAAVALERS